MRGLGLLLGVLMLVPVYAGYTVTWTAPTENTDGSPLTDLAGYNLWCLHAYKSDGVTPTTYGNPAILPADATSFVKDWADPNEWKCRMQAFNDAGTAGPFSPEVFFTLIDPDGDGNGHVDDGTLPPVAIPPPEPPPIVVECPDEPAPAECPPVARQNVFAVTRKGFYTISGPDGIWLTKPDGSTRQLTTRDEAYEWISKDGRSGKYIINPPPYEVFYQ